jgi:hypothetical protein
VGADFDFGTGAKTPGLSGVKPGTAGTFPSGCKTITDEGFSCRHMWATHSGYPDFAGLNYMYGKDASDAGWTCGEDGWWTDPPNQTVKTVPPVVLMTPNVWHVTRDHVKVNTVGAADGIFQTWQDDVLVYDRSNRQMRTRNDVLCGYIMWSWFYGGSTADWAPSTDQHIWIDYVKVWIQ